MTCHFFHLLANRNLKFGSSEQLILRSLIKQFISTATQSYNAIHMLSPVPLPLWSLTLSDASMTGGPFPAPRLASSSSPGRFFLFCLIFPAVRFSCLFLCVGSTVAEWQHSCLTARRFGSIPGSPSPFCVEFCMFLPVSGWVSSRYSGFPHQPKHERPTVVVILGVTKIKRIEIEL
ncbi:hypothetical protein NQD34_003512 [Periophthalmus magnuspinnatus]|nr:hypothetical protein NQD34_003512 [Periophthalmus magnuspinnatus]